MSFEPTSRNALANDAVLTALVPLWDAGEETRVLPVNGECTFGSDRSNNVRIQLYGIAPQHCRVVSQNGATTVQVVDGNPVWLNETAVSDASAISAGDVLAIGPAKYRVEHRRKVATRRSAFPDTPAIAPAAAQIAGGRMPPSKNLPPRTMPTVAASSAPARPSASLNDTDPHRRLLKEREIQLQNWHQQLDRRSEDLDTRSTRLTEQQALLLERQNRFEQDRIEAESRQKQLIDQLVQERNQSAAQNEREAKERTEKLDQRAAELDEREATLHELAQNLQASATVESEAQLGLQAERDAALEEVERIREQLRERETELEVSRAELEAQTQIHETQVESVRAEFSDREAAIAAERKQIEQRAHEVEESSRELDERIAQLEAARDAFEAEMQDRNVEAAATQQRLGTLGEELDSRRAELATESEQHALHQQQLDLQVEQLTAWESELHDRQEEVAGRVRDLKRLSAEVKSSATGDNETPSVADSHAQAEAVEAVRRELEAVTAERDELSEALNELRAAFESVRDELVQAERNGANVGVAVGRTAMADAADAIAERDEALAAANEALKLQVVAVQELETKLEQLSAQFETERQRMADELQQVDQSRQQSNSSEAEERDLLQQIEQLKTELSTSAEAGGPSDELHVQQIEEYENSIRDLSRQLEEARALLDRKEETDDSVEQPYIDLIAELKQRLQEQDEQLAALANAESASDNQDHSGESSEELMRLHRELDDRTHVLDSREAELRERKRMLDHSEGEIEEQRRELLEARHQLELARAELQVAAEPVQHDDNDAMPLIGFDAEPPTGESKDESSESPEAPQVRSELAELFGIGSGSIDEPARHDDPAEPPAVDDYSQEAAAAVSMSFSEMNDVLLEAPIDAETDAAADAAEEQEDEFVSRYMEQLLSRSRAASDAGSTADATKNSNKPGAKKEPEKKPEPRQTKSFIDAYMSGEFKVADEPPTPEAAVEAVVVPRKSAELRPKVDLEALRHEMASFRQLSTKSVENALASHAKRQEKGGITTRVTILIALSVVCVFVLFAALTNLIPFGWIVWLSVLAVMGSGGELGYKMWQVKTKLQESTDLLNHGAAAEVMATNSNAMEESSEATRETAVSVTEDSLPPDADATPDTLSVDDLIVEDEEAVDGAIQDVPQNAVSEVSEPAPSSALVDKLMVPVAAVPSDPCENAAPEVPVQEPTVAESVSGVDVVDELDKDTAPAAKIPKSWLDMLPKPDSVLEASSDLVESAAATPENIAAANSIMETDGTDEHNNVDEADLHQISDADEPSVPVENASADVHPIPFDDITEIVDDLPLTTERVTHEDTPENARDDDAEDLVTDEEPVQADSELVELEGEEYFEI